MSFLPCVSRLRTVDVYKRQHILWILIKFILIILGILLGLALLAVLLLLFCPVRYQARAVKETGSFKETELEARITWLFHVIGVRFCFHNGEGKLVVLFFGVSLETIKGWLKKLKGGRRKNSVSQTSRSCLLYTSWRISPLIL